MTRNRQVILKSRPEGMPKESDFAVVEDELPALNAGEFLVKTHYVSVDPYMRGRMTTRKSYVEPYALDSVILGASAGVVEQSRNPDFAVGAPVVGGWGWREYAVSDGTDWMIQHVDESLGPMSAWLGVLGMPGLTAYFGLLEIGKVQPGDEVFVSGAAGAVGTIAGQIAKLKGCRVAGSAGSDEKVKALLDDFHFDAAFNYRKTPDLNTELGRVCPNGVDVYFDNVGGPMTDAVFRRLNARARVVVCGQIDLYNATTMPTGPRLFSYLIVKMARVEGFLVYQFVERHDEARREIARWMKEGKITYRETIVDGLENAPKAFIGLFTGENIGKQLVHLT